MGPLELLLLNPAAPAAPGDVVEQPLEAFEESLAVNALASIALAQSAARAMARRGRGTIGFVLPGAALRGLPALAPASAGNAALHAFADALRVEVRPQGVRVLSVFPGPMDTGLLARLAQAGPGKAPRAPRGQRPPAQVAERVLGAVERGRERLWVRGPAWGLWHLDHLAPRLTDRILARWRAAARRNPRI